MHDKILSQKILNFYQTCNERKHPDKDIIDMYIFCTCIAVTF